MSSRLAGQKSGRIRHRITDIELTPTTLNRQISAKVLVDAEVVCELPWIKSGQPLRWARLIVCDGSNESKIALDVHEKHSIKDRRFRSEAYVVSSVEQQTETTVGFNGISWNATFKLLTPAAAEQSFRTGLNKLKEMKTTPSTLEKLGKARPVFEAMLQFGSEISEMYPTAKVLFVICTKAWEKLEEQEECQENVRELLDGLQGILDFVELVKEHAQTEKLKGTITEFLMLLEDVSIYVVERAGSMNSPARSLRGLLESKEHHRLKELLGRFERLRAELAIGIGAETHKKVHMLDLNRQLSQLRPAHPSGYDPTRACQEGTRELIISDVILWTEQGTTSERVLWVYGQAGIGKSSIATSVCRQLASDRVLAASFFCKRDDPSLRDPLCLINSIAHGLATRYRPYGQAVADAIQDDQELCTAHMDVRYEGLVKKPLQSLEHPSLNRPLIILIDALDECGTSDTRRNLLRHLLDTSKLAPWLKFIVTSRPDGDIQEFFQSLNKVHVSFRNVQNFDAADDIRAYIQKELGDIARRHQWNEGTIDQLCEKAAGVFIWAAAVKNYLKGFRGSTVSRLQKVLDDQKSTVSDHLDTLYRSVILEGMKDTEEDQKALFRQCIGFIVVASIRQPLSVISLGLLLLGQLDSLALEEVVTSLDAVLQVDQSLDGAVRFYHPSFADYATDPSRSGDLYVFPGDRNIELARGCLQTMERELRFNICELETSYLLNSQVHDLTRRVKEKISNQLSYACTYWVSHLMDTPKGTLIDEVEALMNSPRVLYWLEVLSLLGRVEAGLLALLELQEWLLGSADQLLGSVEDMYRFISAFYDPISSSAPHTYISALAFAPSSAQVVARFKSLFPNTVTVTSGGDQDWPRWLKTLSHPAEVTSLAISSDGRRLVTGSGDGAVRVWDIRSGTIVGEPLFGHSSPVTCVALSPDNSRIVSAAGSELRRWDAKSGVPIGESLAGHSNMITSVAISPDNRYIASGSVDRSIRMWDADSAQVGDSLIGHSGAVLSVAYSPNGDYIISCSTDRTVLIWDIGTNTVVSKLLVDITVTCAIFSPDGSCIAYGSSAGLGKVQHWDPNTSVMAGELLVPPTCHVGSVGYSPDARLVVSGNSDNTVSIWDMEKRAVISEPLIGHSNFVSSVAFLPDGHHIASSSHDKTVRLWDARPESGIAVSRLPVGHSDGVTSVAFSPDGSRIASGSYDKTIRLWDAETGAPVGGPLTGHSDMVKYVAFLSDGKLIISISLDRTLQVWDANTGTPIGNPLVLYSETVRAMAVSPDGTCFAFGSVDATFTVTSMTLPSDQCRPGAGFGNTVPGWSTRRNERTSEQMISHLDSIISLAFSPNSRRIASASGDNTICLWDVQTGATVGELLLGHSDAVKSVAFSPDSRYIASGSSDTTIRVWDTQRGIAVCEPLVGHTDPVTCVAFSPDGSRIASCSYDTSVRLWDSNTGATIGEPFIGHTMIVTSVAFSPNSNRIISGGWDSCVRVWNAKTGTSTNKLESADKAYPQSKVVPKPPIGPLLYTYALPPHPERHDWVSFDGKSLLLWLPAHYRRAYSPNTLYTISASPSESMIQLDFSKFVHGSSWVSVGCDKVRQNPI